MNIYRIFYNVIDGADDRTKSAIVIIGVRDENSPYGIKLALADDLLLKPDDIDVTQVVSVRESMGENQVIHLA